VLRAYRLSLRASVGFWWLAWGIWSGLLGWSVSDRLGFGRGVLTLVGLSVIILLSVNERMSRLVEMDKKMTTATPKQIKVEDIANKSMAQELGATVNESAFRAWYDKSAEMIIAGSLSTRGWSATVDSCEGSTFAKSSWRSYVVDAYNLGSLKGGAKVNVKKLITTTQNALRVMNKAEFKENVLNSSSFAEFCEILAGIEEHAAIIEAEEAKRGAGKQTASEKEIAKQVQAVAVDFDAVVTLALGLFQELEGDKALVHNFENAEKLGRLIKAQIANSRALSVAHPVAVGQ
jgi:hypothetical protein